MPASPLIPCSQLPRTAGYDSCLDFATTGLGACDSLNMSTMAASGDDVFNCGCVALVGSGPAQAMAVAEIDRWERRHPSGGLQAVVQLSQADERLKPESRLPHLSSRARVPYEGRGGLAYQGKVR